jgi:hypothetical protein
MNKIRSLPPVFVRAFVPPKLPSLTVIEVVFA